VADETGQPRCPDDDIERRLELAERVLGHRFGDRELLQRALTHPSAGESRDPSCYYERLEFLGDSVLGFLIAEEVYRRYPDLTEGGMTRIKVSVVEGASLTRVAQDLGLEEALILGDSVTKTGRRGLRSALENTFEALTAALYLDSDLDTVRAWVVRTLGPLISEAPALVPQNPKSRLQEALQIKGSTPTYRTLGHVGPPHDRVFRVVAQADGIDIGEGEGRSKREAEAAAAEAALKTLEGP